MTQSTTGLFTKQGQALGSAVALHGVAVRAHIDGIGATVTIAQQYHNAEQVPIETVYVFPLDDHAAVCGFRAAIGDRLIVAQVRSREEAFAEYDGAMRRGAGAMLLEQERPNIFTASIGNVNPGQSITIEIDYVAPLSREGQALRFVLPTTVSPRYHPSSTDAQQRADQERVSPPVALRVPYGLTMTIDVALGAPIRRIESPGHPLAITLDGATAQLTFSSERVALDRDVVILIEPAAAQQPMALAARDAAGAHIVQVTFLPDGLHGSERSARELVFLVDCSGSMSGSSIAQARQALELCVRQMREGDSLNIVRFGSHHTSLWPAPRSYTAASFAEALAYVAATDADLGGTEILGPLRQLFATEPVAPVRDILLLTDGQVSNDDAVIALCKRHQARNRVFSFGIGAGASASLVNGVASATRGAAEFIAPRERIEPKVLRMFNRIGTALFNEVRIDWGGLDVEQTPHNVPPLFAGDALVVRGRVRSGSATQLVLHADASQWAVPLDLAAATTGGPIPLMWAREMIRELEGGLAPMPLRGSNQRRTADPVREAVRSLALRYGLLSSETSFVAIEERTGADRTTQQAELRRIPIALTDGWGGLDDDADVAYSPQVLYSKPAAPAARLMMSSDAMHSPIWDVSFDADEPLDAGAPQSPPSRQPPAERGRVRAARRAPSPAAPPSSPPMARRSKGSSSDTLLAVLATQAFDGSFPLGDALFALERLQVRRDAIQRAAAVHGAAVVATTLVLAVLEHEFRAHAQEWQGAATKARAWLKLQPQVMFSADDVLGSI